MVNAAIAAIPTPAQIQESFPDIGVSQFLQIYTERAKAMLRVNYRDMDWFEQTPYYQYARVGRKYAAAAGYPVDYNGSAYSFDYMKREEAGTVPRSALDFEQQYGNNYGRFGSVDQTYIAAALATGKVHLPPLTEVTAIRRERSGEFVVSTRQIDRWGKELNRNEIGCGQLYLSAGVLGTTEILLRARDTGALPDLSPEIGRGYGNNGDVMVAHRLGARRSRRYPAVPDGHDQPRRPKRSRQPRLRQHVLDPAAGRDATPSGTTSWSRPAIAPTSRTTPRRTRVAIQWPEGHTEHLRERAKTVFDRVVQANDVDYRDDIFSGEVFAPNTVHPLGGCVRGRATDGYGRVHGYDNLYVNDASPAPGLHRLQSVHDHHRRRRAQHRGHPSRAQELRRREAANRPVGLAMA